jgi:dnd system-associated protein 4
MPERRIRIAKNKVAFVLSLVESKKDGPVAFNTYVDLLVFAASLGYKQKRKSKIEQPASDPSPIRQEVFEGNYSYLIGLLAVVDTKDPGILSNSAESQERRVTIFEEFANGGLSILEEKLKGSTDQLGTLALIVGREKIPERANTSGFDLETLIG